MEELLNKLIEKGWKPRGHKAKSIEVFSNYMNINFDDVSEECTVAEIVRKSSGLWQFVCENGMIALKLSARMKNPRIDWEDVDDHDNGHIVMNYKQKCEGDKAEYRIIESALCDEDKLEDFILSNVKIEGEV